MRRRLREVLLLFQSCQGQFCITCYPLHQCIIFFFLIILGVYAHETVKLHLRRRHGKPVSRRIDLHRRRLIDCRRHAACHKTFPDQLVKPELIPGQRLLEFKRRPADIRRSDRFVGILNLLFTALLLLGARSIRGAVPSGDKLLRGSFRLCGHSGGIRTQISDNTHRTVSLDIDTLIELLCQPHRFLGRKVQYFACLLL